MTTLNFTEDGNHRTLQEMYYSAGLNGGMVTSLSVINSCLAITAFLENTLILVALHKESSLHPPSKLLYRCLATSDLCVGLIAEPLYVAYLMSLVNERRNICFYLLTLDFIASYILASVSLFTLTAISVDRLLALLLGLRYRSVVTLKRTITTIMTVWVMSIVASTINFWNKLIFFWYGHIGILLCLVTSMFSYIKIFLTLRHHQTQVHDHAHQEQPSQTRPLNIARYKKAVSSALWVQLTLVICYLPYGITDALSAHAGLHVSLSLLIAWQFTTTLVFLNSSLNPIIYCWKIREVKQAVKDTIRELWIVTSRSCASKRRRYNVTIERRLAFNSVLWLDVFIASINSFPHCPIPLNLQWL